MICGDTWQMTKQVQEISYPDQLRPTASYSLGTKGYFIPIGNQELFGWDTKLTSPSSIELKMEVYVHIPLTPWWCAQGQLCAWFYFFILATLFLCCLMSLAPITTHASLQTVALAHSASVFLLNMFMRGLDWLLELWCGKCRHREGTYQCFEGTCSHHLHYFIQ